MKRVCRLFFFILFLSSLLFPIVSFTPIVVVIVFFRDPIRERRIKTTFLLSLRFSYIFPIKWKDTQVTFTWNDDDMIPSPRFLPGVDRECYLAEGGRMQLMPSVRGNFLQSRLRKTSFVEKRELTEFHTQQRKLVIKFFLFFTFEKWIVR